MLHCYFATVWIRNSGGIATTSTLPTLHHWICQGWDCKNVGSILQQEPHCLDEQQRQCYRLKKSSDQKHTSLLQRYSATDQTWTHNLRTKGHLLHRYNSTDWKKRQKSWEVDADYVMAKWSLFKRGWSELLLWMFECMFECLFAAKTRGKTICVLKLD